MRLSLGLASLTGRQPGRGPEVCQPRVVLHAITHANEHSHAHGASALRSDVERTWRRMRDGASGTEYRSFGVP